MTNRATEKAPRIDPDDEGWQARALLAFHHIPIGSAGSDDLAFARDALRELLSTSPALHQDWGTASDVRADGFVNPSSVNYAPSEASAIKKAGIRGEVPVARLSADWQVITPPGQAT